MTVVSLFSGGVNEQFLNEDVGYRSIFKKAIPGNSHFMKLLSPGQLHDICVKEKYDIEVLPLTVILDDKEYKDGITSILDP